MTESFSEIIICRCVPALDSDGSAAESPSKKERGSSCGMCDTAGMKSSKEYLSMYR